MPNGIGWTEVFGITPISDRLRDVHITLRGDEHTPPTVWGPSSLKIFRPAQALRLWRGQWAQPRRAVMYNLFNHTPTPVTDGWSVRKTQVRDFRGGSLTYNSHNGTDFAMPVGTTLVSPAAARVGWVASEFNRGGLKVVLDHGDGLMTGHAHLGRALVKPGQTLQRGEPFALSGMSGINGFLFFPWESPHLHMNTWWYGEAVDPFWLGGRSLWSDAEPVPASKPDADLPPARWNPAAVLAQIEACTHPERRAMLHHISDPDIRACAVVHERHYYPTRFSAMIPLHDSTSPPAPRLSLPLAVRDVDGIAWPTP